MLTKCPDCGGDLEEGANMDSTSGGIGIQRYAKATIPRDVKVKLSLIETDFEDIRRVISYRCTKCNRIYSYAQDIVLGKGTIKQANKIWLFFIIFIISISIIISLLGLSRGFK